MSFENLKKGEDLDKTYCKSIATSISQIIRFSLDEDFRKRSFELFGVSSTKETEKEVNKRLMSIIENGNTINWNFDKLQTQSKTGVEDKENLEIQNECLEDEQMSSFSSKNLDSNSQTLLPNENIFKRNWLQISSRQYKETIKRRKLNYYSQPQMNEILSTNSQSNLYFSNSQPISTHSNSMEDINSEASDDDINYWRKKFQQSFNDKTNKYFKKNLKNEKHPSF